MTVCFGKGINKKDKLVLNSCDIVNFEVGEGLVFSVYCLLFSGSAPLPWSLSGVTHERRGSTVSEQQDAIPRRYRSFGMTNQFFKY